MKHKAAGYGVYFMILERLRECHDFTSLRDYKMIAFDLRVTPQMVQSVVEDFDLFDFSEDKKHFFSKSFVRRMQSVEDIRNKRVQAGLASGAKRRKKKSAKKESPAEDEPKKDSKGWTDEDYAKQIVEKYNGLIAKYQARLRPVKKLTPERVRLCMDIYTKFPKSEEIITALNNAVQSEYLNGKTNRRQRPAEFDWIIQPDNFLKCLENNF
jgi:hypothetical protein